MRAGLARPLVSSPLILGFVASLQQRGEFLRERRHSLQYLGPKEDLVNVAHVQHVDDLTQVRPALYSPSVVRIYHHVVLAINARSDSPSKGTRRPHGGLGCEGAPHPGQTSSALADRIQTRRRPRWHQSASSRYS